MKTIDKNKNGTKIQNGEKWYQGDIILFKKYNVPKKYIFIGVFVVILVIIILVFYFVKNKKKPDNSPKVCIYGQELITCADGKKKCIPVCDSSQPRCGKDKCNAICIKDESDVQCIDDEVCKNSDSCPENNAQICCKEDQGIFCDDTVINNPKCTSCTKSQKTCTNSENDKFCCGNNEKCCGYNTCCDVDETCLGDVCCNTKTDILDTDGNCCPLNKIWIDDGGSKNCCSGTVRLAQDGKKTACCPSDEIPVNKIETEPGTCNSGKCNFFPDKDCTKNSECSGCKVIDLTMTTNTGKTKYFTDTSYVDVDTNKKTTYSGKGAGMKFTLHTNSENKDNVVFFTITNPGVDYNNGETITINQAQMSDITQIKTLTMANTVVFTIIVNMLDNCDGLGGIESTICFNVKKDENNTPEYTPEDDCKGELIVKQAELCGIPCNKDPNAGRFDKKYCLPDSPDNQVCTEFSTKDNKTSYSCSKDDWYWDDTSKIEDPNNTIIGGLSLNSCRQYYQVKNTLKTCRLYSTDGQGNVPLPPIVPTKIGEKYYCPLFQRDGSDNIYSAVKYNNPDSSGGGKYTISGINHVSGEYTGYSYNSDYKNQPIKPCTGDPDKNCYTILSGKDQSSFLYGPYVDGLKGTDDFVPQISLSTKKVKWKSKDPDKPSSGPTPMDCLDRYNDKGLERVTLTTDNYCKADFICEDGYLEDKSSILNSPEIDIDWNGASMVARRANTKLTTCESGYCGGFNTTTACKTDEDCADYSWPSGLMCENSNSFKSTLDHNILTCKDKDCATPEDNKLQTFPLCIHKS
jgi:hypothetical protein